MDTPRRRQPRLSTRDWFEPIGAGGFLLARLGAGQGPNILPIVGTHKRTQLKEALGGLDITLSTEDLARIEQAVPTEAVAGTRYDPRLMTMLDSERTDSSAG